MEKNFEMDMTPLDKGQMNAMKRIVLISQDFIDRVELIMKQYGMWEKGFRFNACLCPDLLYFTGGVTLNRTTTDGKKIINERIETSRGQATYENKWELSRNSTSEGFVHLLDAEKDGDGAEKVPFAEKPLPSDSLWIGSADNDPDVDSREWDVNDSLS